MPKRRSPIVAGATVLEGPKVAWDNSRLSMAALKAWVGERITITIAQEVQKRSLRAQAYYRGVVLKLMAEESGYDPDELHEWLKLRFNSKTIADPVTGEEIRIACTTTTLSVEDYGIYIERCMVLGAETYGISFPEPRRHEEYREGKAA